MDTPPATVLTTRPSPSIGAERAAPRRVAMSYEDSGLHPFDGTRGKDVLAARRNDLNDA